jgi:hypothetical protein
MEFEITDVRGARHALRAVHLAGGGWLLQTDVDGRVFTHRCRDWQAVERTVQLMRARPPAVHCPPQNVCSLA